MYSLKDGVHDTDWIIGVHIPLCVHDPERQTHSFLSSIKLAKGPHQSFSLLTVQTSRIVAKKRKQLKRLRGSISYLPNGFLSEKWSYCKDLMEKGEESSTPQQTD